MVTQSYFELLSQSETFGIDQDSLKKSYYKVSRTWHPDFFSNATEEEQARASQWTELINDAYRTLSDEMRRIQYILRRQGVLIEGDKTDLDQAFLLEMMEINEAIFEAQSSDEEGRWDVVLEDIAAFEDSLTTAGQAAISQYDLLIGDKNADNADVRQLLAKVREYYLKRKYLDRMKSIIEGQNAI
jgi:molecular chaperone HscB